VPGCSLRQIKIKKKKRFCRHDDIKSFTSFILQPKSATEISDDQYIRNLKNKIKKNILDVLAEIKTKQDYTL
jgi:hypothetical protein